MGRAFMNSLGLAIGVTALSTMFNTLAGHAFAAAFPAAATASLRC